MSSGDPIIVPIHSDNSNAIPEWAMIELNGELILPSCWSEKENPSLWQHHHQQPTGAVFPINHLELGSIRLINEQPVMIVGTHELKGSVEVLKQPFCVLQKEHATSHTTSSTSFQVKGVITKKYLFNQYPKTIMR